MSKKKEFLTADDYCSTCGNWEKKCKNDYWAKELCCARCSFIYNKNCPCNSCEKNNT